MPMHNVNGESDLVCVRAGDDYSEHLLRENNCGLLRSPCYTQFQGIHESSSKKATLNKRACSTFVTELSQDTLTLKRRSSSKSSPTNRTALEPLNLSPAQRRMQCSTTLVVLKDMCEGREHKVFRSAREILSPGPCDGKVTVINISLLTVGGVHLNVKCEKCGEAEDGLWSSDTSEIICLEQIPLFILV